MGDRRSSEPARVDGLRTGLQRFIEGRAESAVSVVSLSPLPGGTMRHAWAVDLDVPSGPLAGSHRLIYLQDRGWAPLGSRLSPEDEFRVLSFMYCSPPPPAGPPPRPPPPVPPRGRGGGPPRGPPLPGG